MLEKKAITHFDKDILELLTKMRFKHNRISINGSSTIKSLRFYGDIDMFSQLKTKYTAEELYNGIKNILFKITHSPNYYFLELKVQLKNGEKIRVFPNESFHLSVISENFKKLDFLKIDVAVFSNYRFVEASCIYQVSEQNTNIIKSLKNDIIKYSTEHKYFKMLKRMFSLNNIQGRKTQLTQLFLDFFNSKTGYFFFVLSNLETIQLVHKFYKDHLTEERINVNLKLFKLKPHEKEEIEKKVNKDAKNFFDAISKK
jgi:hypothetical protein